MAQYRVTALPLGGVAYHVAQHGVFYAARHPVERLHGHRRGVVIVGRYRTRREAVAVADRVRAFAVAASVGLGRGVNDGCPVVERIG